MAVTIYDDQSIPVAEWDKIVKDLGPDEAAKVKKNVAVEGIDDEDLCVISPEEGDYLTICLNGNVKRLPTGVKLFLSADERSLLGFAREANTVSAPEKEAEQLGKE